MSIKKLIAFCAFLFLADVSNAQNWNVVEIGPAPILETFDLVVGEGRNDGLNRIYVTTKDGSLYEWTFDSTTRNWNYISVGQNLKGLVMVDLGKARNDDKNRLYVSEFVKGGRVIEYEWNGTNWLSNKVDQNIHSLTLVVGDGRNDGKNYLYVGSTDVGIWEYAYNGSTWDKTQIHFQASEGVGIVGDSRNDGVNRLLLTSNDVKEYTWDGTQYTISTPSPKIEWPDAIHLGQGRNDGINRIYANCFAGTGRVEYTWNGSSWTSTKVNPKECRGDIYTAAVHKDGLTRVYTTNSEYFKGKAGNFLEFLWNKNTNQYDSSIVLDAKSGATAMVVAGYGRNDDTMRLYATRYTKGTIYEVTHIQPYTIEKVGVQNLKLLTAKVQVFPNPTVENMRYSIENPDRLELKVELLNYMGDVLKEARTSTENHIKGALKMNEYANGIYYLRVSSGGRFQVQQLVLAH